MSEWIQLNERMNGVMWLSRRNRLLFNRLSPTILPRISRNERRTKAAGDPLIHNNTPSIRADIDRKAIAARHITSSVRTHSKTTSVYSQPWLYRNRQQRTTVNPFVFRLQLALYVGTATAVGVIYTPSICSASPFRYVYTELVTFLRLSRVQGVLNQKSSPAAHILISARVCLFYIQSILLTQQRVASSSSRSCTIAVSCWTMDLGYTPADIILYTWRQIGLSAI